MIDGYDIIVSSKLGASVIGGVKIKMLNYLATLTQKLKGDDLARHSALMVTFSLLAAFFNYLYQLSMGILLTPVQYGTLFSLTSLFIIISVFATSLQTSITKFASKFKAENKLDRANYLWHFSLKRTFLLGLLFFLVLALVTPLLSDFLNIDNNWYPIVLFSSLLFAFALPVNLGMLQGLQRFLHLGFTSSLWAFLKVAVAVLLVYVGFGIYGGLAAFIIAYVIVFFVTRLLLRDLAEVGNEKFEVSGLSSYAGLAFIAILSFTMLTNIDVVLVKHYLSPENAGNYSAISVMGRVALYAPIGVATAMFPKTSELFETKTVHLPMLRKAMVFTLLLTGAVVIIYWLFPEFIVNFVFGGRYPMAVPYLFKYGLAMALFAFCSLLVSYFLSVNQTKIVYSLLGAMLLQITLISLFHSSIAQLVDIMLTCGILCTVSLLPFYFRVRSKRDGGEIAA